MYPATLPKQTSYKNKGHRSQSMPSQSEEEEDGETEIENSEITSDISTDSDEVFDSTDSNGRPSLNMLPGTSMLINYINYFV